MGTTENYYIDIIEHETSETIKTLGPYASERVADKAERGLNYQMDHSRFYSVQRKEASA